MIRVIVTTSDVVARDAIIEVLRSDPGIEVVGMARNGAEAVELTKRLRPDIVIMGVRLRNLDGFEATKEIMIERPTPIVLVTGDPDPKAVEVSVLALRAGALAVVEAPNQRTTDALVQRRFLSTIRSMSQVKVVRRWRERAIPAPPPVRSPPREKVAARIVAVAASTGGPAALQLILSQLPRDFPAPILVVQHISAGFMEGLATWLNQVTSLRIKVAEDGEPLQPHTVYLAADDRHVGVAARSRIVLTTDPPIGGFRPSANFLFESAASFGSEALAIILTGMGEDGVHGLRTLHRAGGKIIAQDQSSSVVFGMPKSAIEAGIVDQVCPISSMADAILSAVQPVTG